MRLLERVPGLVPVLALAVAALAAGGRVGAAIGGVDALLVLLGLAGAFGGALACRANAHRVLPPEPVEAGLDVTVSLRVDLPQLWPLAVLTLRDEPPSPLGAAPQLRSLAGLRRRLVCTYTLQGVPRGLHRFESALLEETDALPLTQRSIPLSCPGELLVYPRRVPLDLPPGRRGAQAAERLPRGTRDFQPGDAPGRLHAARTAQRGFPQVREFEELGDLPHIVLLWAPGADAEDAELALSCAASLATAWLQAGEPVGLLAPGAPQRSLPAQRGEDQERRLLATLAALSAAELGADTLPKPPERADVWLLTTRADAPSLPSGRTLRLGKAGGDGALLALSDLPRAFEGGEP